MAYRHVPLLLFLPLVGIAADKDVIELQRQIALLNDRVRTMQRSVDQRMADMQALLRQTLDRVNEGRGADAEITSTVKEGFAQQEQTIAKPVAALDARVDRMRSELLKSGDALADLDARVRKLDQTLSDADNAVRVIPSPPPPPPSASQALGGPPPGVTADGLFQAALRDQLAGQSQTADQEFRDYLKYFDNTELTAGAQFHLGELALSGGDADSAVKACDLVLERYPKSGKAPDAMYLKGRALEKMGKRAQAVKEFKLLIRSYPGSEAAKSAQADLNRPRR